MSYRKENADTVKAYIREVAEAVDSNSRANANAEVEAVGRIVAAMVQADAIEQLAREIRDK